MKDNKYKMTKKREKQIGGPKKNMRTEKTRGITLISLVITIIILLILAGVTLNLTLGDRGIITQAQQAKEAHEIATIKENIKLDILNKELEKEGESLTKEELEEIAENHGELQEDGNTIITDDGYEINIDEIYKPGEGTSGGVIATGNATEADVLEGKTFSNSSGTGLSGTMTNRGTLNFNPNESTIQTVEPGYYSGGTLDSSEAYNAGLSAGQTSSKDNVTYVNVQTTINTTNSPNFSIKIPSGRTKCYAFISAWQFTYDDMYDVTINGLTKIRSTSHGDGYRVTLCYGDISSEGGTLSGTVNSQGYNRTVNVDGMLVLY